MRAIYLVTALLLTAWALPASADCGADIAAVKVELAKAKSAKKIAAAKRHMEKAESELAEGDEDECQEAVDKARKALKRRRPAPQAH